MKKILTFCALVAISGGCAEQKLTLAELPKPVVKSFGLAYPEIEGERWVKENQKGKTIYAAIYKKDGKKSEVEFDEKGNFVREKYK